MRDIVATVQREQDEIIRADLPGVLVVQGGPGTGKTAVALHRAAYLLYTHRFPLERQGVLVVGPNTVFLRYIGQVLPSLGERGVTLSTVEGLVATARVRGVDDRVAARVKGDARMARLLARAVRDRQRPLKRDVAVGWGPVSLRLTAEATEQIVASARRRPGSHNSRRRFVETLVARRLHEQLVDALERRVRVNLRGIADREEDEMPDEAGELSAEELGRELRRRPEVAVALDRMWPVLLPEELLHDLYGAPPLLALAGRGIFGDDEIKALERPRSSSLDTIPWTAADLALLDEARVLLGTRRRHDEDVRTYGHIVVDEAQDLTPMQLRMLTRRSLSGSMTVVGDIAQATGHRAPRTWADITEHLPGRRPSRVAELSVNYRTPSEIMTLATRVLEAAAPNLTAPRSVRSTGEHPVVEAVDPAALVATVTARAHELAKAPDGGSVAVICPPSLRDQLDDALSSLGAEFGAAETAGLASPVTLIPVTVVKGLEFDSVLVVEPGTIVRESPQGLRALYVALTRATKRLTVLHAEPLPAPMHEPHRDTLF
jgi:DNA helicase IV